MDNSKNMEPGIRNTAVQDSPNKEQRKKEGRPAISAKAQTILDFLRGCTPYEADSIRVMVGYGTGNGDTATIEATDMLAVNRFLNHGLTKENGTDGEAVMKHRQERAQNDGSRQGFCRHRPALPRQRRTDENLFRLQGGGGRTGAPAIPTRRQREPELTSNRNGVSDGQGNSRTHYLIETVVGFPILHSLIFY